MPSKILDVKVSQLTLKTVKITHNSLETNKTHKRKVLLLSRYKYSELSQDKLLD